MEDLTAIIEGENEAPAEGEEFEEFEQEIIEGEEPEPPAEEPPPEIPAVDTEAQWKAKVDALEQQFAQMQQTQQQTKPDFIEVDYDRLNQHVTATLDQIETLKLEGRTLDALRMQRQMETLIADVETNEQKKAAWQQSQQNQIQQQQRYQATVQAVSHASNLIKTHHNVPDDVWTAGLNYFQQAQMNDPILAAKYQEKIFNQGVVEAVEWAYQYVMTNMPQATIPNKPQAPTPGASAQTSEVNLNKLLEKARQSGRPEDFIAYRHAKKRARS